MRAFALFAILVCVATPASPSPNGARKGEPRVRMLVGDLFFHNYIATKADAEGEWWALCRGSDNANDALISVNAKLHAIPSTSFPERNDWRLSVVGCKKPIALFRDLAFLTEHSAPRATIKRLSPTRSQITLGDQVVSLSQHQGERRSTVLVAQQRRQVLDRDTSDDKEQPKLLWAGDLDGDGRLDFLLQAAYGEPETIRLYLSSAALEGEIVHAVVEQVRQDPDGC